MRTRAHRGFALFRKPLIGGVLLLVFDVVFAAFTMTEITTPSIGTVLGGSSGRQFVLTTSDTITGANSADYLYGAVTGVLRLRKTQGAASVNIVAENISTTGGLTANAIPCQWRNQTPTTCNGAGINVTVGGNGNLRVGVDISTSQIHGGGDTASITFDVTVTFL
jgi:hypothetical protein